MAVRKWVALCAVALAVVMWGALVGGPQLGAAPADTSAIDLEPQWLWGEVVAVNLQSKTIQVKYLDYDTDIEKELVLTVDDKTKYENAKGLEEIKPQDTISVDYLVSSDNVNLAVAISLEKLEDMDEGFEDIDTPARERVGSDPGERVQAAADETASADVQPEGGQ